MNPQPANELDGAHSEALEAGKEAREGVASLGGGGDLLAEHLGTVYTVSPSLYSAFIHKTNYWPMKTDLEAFIAQLKQDGCSKVASIMKVASAYKVGMDAAKVAVHESTAWAPEKLAHEDFHRKVVDALGESEKKHPEGDWSLP